MRRFPLGWRLYLAEAVVASACLGSFAGLYRSVQRREAALGTLRFVTDYTRAAQAAAANGRRLMDSLVSKGIAQPGQGGERRNLGGILSELKSRLQQTGVFARTLGTSEEERNLKQLRKMVASSESLLDRIERLKREGRTAEATVLYEKRLIPLLRRHAFATLSRELREQNQRARDFHEGLQTANRRTFGWAFGAVLCSLFLLVVWTRRFLAYLQRNLERFRRAVAAIASGNLDIALAAERDDELGRLSRALNEMTQRLEQAQRRALEMERTVAQGRLASGAAHALNNPLAAVIGNAELLLRRDSLGPEEREEVRVIREQARRCDAILRNLRQFASEAQGERRPVRLEPLLRDLVELLEPSLAPAGIAVDLKLDPALPPVTADAHQLRQVFYNLFMNSVRALRGRPEPRITVTARCEAGAVVTAVEDNGEGIAPENLPKVFEPFFTTRPATEGVGLGLSSALGIVREHGGTLSAAAQPGRGARFDVRLPQSQGAAESVRRSGPARVLVVDDEAEILSLVGRVLGQEGHVVECVADPRKALEAADRDPYDLIVSDYRMDEMDGVALFEAIRRRRPQAAARFVFSTGEIVSKEFQGFADRHGIPVLLKPFDLEELVSVVRQRLGD